ncbi:cardiolipin synthase [Winogradskyella aurantia]|uniref:Cardiolipin synthase n=1 Tax=Winogradskyella aurantia TaxID=1915063 RepID=A0A265US40_9FLAO|nr:cardiolipin synthase [Winogradskyella aurantia]OZV68116.1 cardiolipin synthase [Winogradskyella aurantia]
MEYIKTHIWTLLVAINYALAIALIVFILFKQLNPSKTISYILVLMVFPFLGLIVYVLFGQDYRKTKIFDRKNILDQQIVKELLDKLKLKKSQEDQVEEILQEKSKLFKLIYNGEKSKLTTYNHVRVLINAEEKFEVLFSDLKKAKHHIHLEYYIFNDDVIGTKLIDLLCKKAQEGVEVRFVYDDVGSKISSKNKRRLTEAGVLHFPFMPVLFSGLTGKMNYRDHRKIIVIDGEIGYLGGINIADHYINSGKTDYWRDTHIRIDGEAVKPLQILFFTTWDFVQDGGIKLSASYFPEYRPNNRSGVQIISSGPDTDWPNIMEAIFAAITAARSFIYITTPYFIPNDEILAALQIAARSGVEVKLLIPYTSDSWISGSATNSYLQVMLEAGVEVYRYKRGFIHAKTMVLDDEVCSVGTANMDYRSFEINFEVNAFIYDKEISKQLRMQFLADLEDAEVLSLDTWEKRPLGRKLIESLSKLLAPLL